jgi:hypothetical protein
VVTGISLPIIYYICVGWNIIIYVAKIAIYLFVSVDAFRKLKQCCTTIYTHIHQRQNIQTKLETFIIDNNLFDLMEKFVEIVSRGSMLLYTKQTVFAKKP